MRKHRQLHRQQLLLTFATGRLGSAAQIEGHGDLQTFRAVEGHRMLNPIHTTTLGPIPGEQQLGFFQGFALLLGLLLPVAVEEPMGSQKIAPP